jgi:DNA polymerase-3 subunit delta
VKKVPATIPSVVVLSGRQRHLKHVALEILLKRIIDDDETSLTRFAGRDAQLQTVSDELYTVSMWGDRRLVIVEDADEFVTKYRAGLEKLVDKPAKKSVLVLDVESWVKTTRIYKQIQAVGLEIECSDMKGSQLLKWIQETAGETYNCSITREAAVLLVELIGEELGMLDSEIAKVASYVGAQGKVGVDDVKGLVGGWRLETTWAMTDATRDKDLDFALKALDQLLTAGEAPLKLYGGISFVFKKFSQAADFSRTTTLDQALRQAGAFPNAIAPGQTYLRRLGRPKAERILQRLLRIEAGLKGMDPLPERVQLERLLLDLAGKLE